MSTMRTPARAIERLNALARRSVVGVAIVVAGVLSAGEIDAASVFAQTTDGCDVQQIAIPDVADHEVTDLGGSGFENFGEAGQVSDVTAFRVWTQPESGAGLMLFLIDTRDPATVADEVSGFLDGFVEASRRNGFTIGDLDRSRPDVRSAAASGAGLTQRVVATSSGRLVVALVAVAPDDFVADDEETFLFDQLDRQLQRVPDACVEAVADESSSDAGLVVGAAAALVMVVAGIPSLVAWLRDGATRRKDRSPASPREGVRWIDLARTAERRSRDARVGQILIVASLGVALLATFAFIERRAVFLLAIPLGLALASTGRLLLRRRDPDGAVPEQWWRRGRRRALGAVLLIASYAALAFGLVGVARQLHIATLSDNELEVEAILADTEPEVLRNSGLLIAVVGFVLAGALYRLARWVVRRSADQVRASDPRPPVLVLRPFRDDGIKIRVPTDQFGLTSLLHIRRRERLEEFVAWNLTNHGPVTTVADPGRRRIPLGAARERLDHDEWIPIVRERIAGAGLISVIVGATEHLRIELDMILELGRLGDVIFIVPPTDDAVERWAAVADAVGAPGTLPEGDRRTVVLVVRGGVVHAFHGATRNAAAYEAALHEAVAFIGSTPDRPTPGSVGGWPAPTTGTAVGR